MRARHILFDNEAEAKKVIADCKGGAKFEDVAKAKSNDPSAGRTAATSAFLGGRDGAGFRRGGFRMKPARSTITLVKTQFGWHVIKMTTAAPRRRPRSRR